MRSKRSKLVARPPALRRGDSIALIRPAGKLEAEKFQRSLEWIREAGFFATSYPGNFVEDSYFSASDEDRAREWAWAFSQPGVKAVLSCRAGYGSMRMIAALQKLKLKPSFKSKIFVGYSDLTFAHHWLLNSQSHLSFHGPLVGHLEKEDLAYFLDQLVNLPEKKFVEDWEEIEIYQRGKASGVLVGGNLSLLQTAGIAKLPDRNLILAIEDVNEDFYRLDRILWSLIHAGYSKYVKGIILGSFHQCGKDAEKFPFERVLETCRRLTTGPIWTSANFGHGLKRQRILAIGSQVSMEGRRLNFSHSLVERNSR